MIKQLITLLAMLKRGKKKQNEIVSLQDERLRAVLVSAYNNVVYYKRAMQEAGYDPNVDYTGPEDLKRIPILTKQKLKAFPVTDFIHKEHIATYQNGFSDSTSGSTGIPLVIYRSGHERMMQISKWLRVLFDNGYSIFDKTASFTSPARLNEGQSVVHFFGLFRRKAIDYTLPASSAVKTLRDYRPDIIYGNKSSFDLLCRELEGKKISFSPKFIVVTGEIIPPHVIKKYEAVLSTKVVQSYGSVEMGVMAYSKGDDSQTLSLNQDTTYFEFLRDNGEPASPGERARIVVTDLSGKLMPFIRYEQGDRVYFDEIESDGEKVKIITKIEGREDDVFIMPGGEETTYLTFYEIMDQYQNIEQFKIIQKSIDAFDVLIVSDPDYFEQILPDLSERLLNVSEEKLMFDIRNVGTIAPDSNGKIRMLISKIS
jgi:phenylacetate-CoA ligase